MNTRLSAHRTVRIGTAIFLALHAVAHAPGVLGAWKLAEIENASYRPNILLTDASDTVVAILGGFWLLAALAFLLAAYGLLRRASWGTSMTFFAAVLSLALTILWLDDAIAGLVVNIVILAGLLLFNVWSLWQGFESDQTHTGEPFQA